MNEISGKCTFDKVLDPDTVVSSSGMNQVRENYPIALSLMVAKISSKNVFVELRGVLTKKSDVQLDKKITFLRLFYLKNKILCYRHNNLVTSVNYTYRYKYILPFKIHNS